MTNADVSVLFEVMGWDGYCPRCHNRHCELSRYGATPVTWGGCDLFQPRDPALLKALLVVCFMREACARARAVPRKALQMELL